MARDESTKYFQGEFLPQYGEEIVGLLRERGLNRGLLHSSSPEEIERYQEGIADVLNDAAIQINARLRRLTTTDMLRMDLERKIRVAAHKAGLNSKIIEQD